MARQQEILMKPTRYYSDKLNGLNDKTLENIYPKTLYSKI